jgi:NAD(P)-dependent dehydrogenase (short-subunit alcohol dehydrogenase family)
MTDIFNNKDLTPEMKEQFIAMLKTQIRAADRVGTQEDIADAVLMIASNKGRWITGQFISVSGGMTGH